MAIGRYDRASKTRGAGKARIRKRLWREIEAELAVQEEDIGRYTLLEYDILRRRLSSKAHAIAACQRAMGAYTALRWMQGATWKEALEEATKIRMDLLDEVHSYLTKFG